MSSILGVKWSWNKWTIIMQLTRMHNNSLTAINSNNPSRWRWWCKLISDRTKLSTVLWLWCSTPHWVLSTVRCPYMPTWPCWCTCRMASCSLFLFWSIIASYIIFFPLLLLNMYFGKRCGIALKRGSSLNKLRWMPDKKHSNYQLIERFHHRLHRLVKCVCVFVFQHWILNSCIRASPTMKWFVIMNISFHHE